MTFPASCCRRKSLSYLSLPLIIVKTTVEIDLDELRVLFHHCVLVECCVNGKLLKILMQQQMGEKLVARELPWF